MKGLTRSMRLMNATAVAGLIVGLMTLLMSELFGFKMFLKIGIFTVLVLWIVAVGAWISNLRRPRGDGGN